MRWRPRSQNERADRADLAPRFEMTRTLGRQDALARSTSFPEESLGQGANETRASDADTMWVESSGLFQPCARAAGHKVRLHQLWHLAGFASDGRLAERVERLNTFF